MKALAYYLDLDGQGLLKLAFFNVLGSYEYVEICGNRIDASHQWCDHNVYDIEEKSNSKYVGWIVHRYNEYGSSCGEVNHKFYIPSWVLEAKVKDWRHAKNLFSKYLKMKS